MKKSLCAILLLSFFAPLLANEDCDDAIQEGIQKYNAGKYTMAKQLFEFATGVCGADYGDVASWISKCDKKLVSQLSLNKTSSQRVTINQSAISTTPSASLDRERCEYNVNKNGKMGLLSHVKFTVKNMQNRTGKVAVYFYKDDENSTPLKDKNNSYRTKEGNVGFYIDYTPQNNNQVYEDFLLFMPNEELDITALGRHFLKYRVVILDDCSNELAHSEWSRFNYTLK